MTTFLARRLGLALVQLLLVCILVFAMLHLIPGDPALVILGSEHTPAPEVLAAVRQKLGLNEPLGVQFASWLVHLARLDLGRSLMDNYPVADEVRSRLPRTLELVVSAIVVASLVGIPLGVGSALRRNSLADKTASTAFSLGLAIPTYVIGTFLVLIVSVELRALPGSGYTPISEGMMKHLAQLTLPTIALAIGLAAIIGRMARSAILDVVGEDYIRTARAKGLPPRLVIYKHALRNALLPIITVIGVQFGTLIGGTVLVENIFNWPGLSTLLINATRERDYPMVQGAVLSAAVLVVCVQMVVDVLYALANPKLRYS
ncbi:MAG TPA: ABC transporter permease [bacterium]|nr:ABC transporter permease [bacterium]